MSAVGDAPSTVTLLPPSLIHELRTRSFPRLFRMTGNPGNRGFGRVLRQRIRDIVLREKTMVERAITVAYMGSYLVDHLTQAEKTAARLLDQREITEAEEHHLWERTYGRVLLQLASELPDGPRLLDEVARLDRYDELPMRIHQFRTRHWKRIAHFLEHASAGVRHGHAGVTLHARAEEIVNGSHTARRKAMMISLIASMLADRHCWMEHQDWAHAFRETMIDLYPLLVRHGDVLAELIRLDDP